MNDDELSLRTSQRFKQLRLSANKTQLDVADATGLAVSYVSRLENHRVVPTVTTLGRVARALDVPIEAFFESEAKASERQIRKARECPVSISGACFMSQPAGHRASKDASQEHFTKRRIALLRKCNYLLQRGDNSEITAFTTLLDALLARVASTTVASAEDAH